METPHEVEWVCPVRVHTSQDITSSRGKTQSVQPGNIPEPEIPDSFKAPVILNNANDFQKHMRTRHGDRFTEAQIAVLVKRSARPSQFFSTCPFCIFALSDLPSVKSENREFSSMQSHIAGHLLDLALMSLPLSKRKVDDPDEEFARSSNSGKHVLRSNISDDLRPPEMKDGPPKFPPDPDISQPEILGNQAMEKLCDLLFPLGLRVELGPINAQEIEALADEWFLAKLLAIFSSRSSAVQRITERELQAISAFLLYTNHKAWSRFPRLYCTLRMVEGLDQMDTLRNFVKSEFWLPLTDEDLQGMWAVSVTKPRFSDSAFLEKQNYALTPESDDNIDDGRHRHFLDNGDVPVIPIKTFQREVWGDLEQIQSTGSLKQYTRKTIRRSGLPNRVKVKGEIELLKTFSHVHVPRIVGTYITPELIGIISTPMADFTLQEYLELEPPALERDSLAPTFFGCLASALCHYHDSEFRVRYISLESTIIKGSQIFLDLPIYGTQTIAGATASPSSGSLRFLAPEILSKRQRNSAADVWALGCVFLAICITLNGESLSAFEANVLENNGEPVSWSTKLPHIEKWWSQVELKEGLHTPLQCIKDILRINPSERPSAAGVLDRVKLAQRESKYNLIGSCCIGKAEETRQIEIDPGQLGEEWRW